MVLAELHERCARCGHTRMFHLGASECDALEGTCPCVGFFVKVDPPGGATRSGWLVETSWGIVSASDSILEVVGRPLEAIVGLAIADLYEEKTDREWSSSSVPIRRTGDNSEGFFTRDGLTWHVVSRVERLNDTTLRTDFEITAQSEPPPRGARVVRLRSAKDAHPADVDS